MRKPFTLHRPSPAMAVALTALFIALGGTSYAVATVPDNSVGTAQLKANAVTTSKIDNGAVTKPKLNLAGVVAPNSTKLGGQFASAYVLVDNSGDATQLVGAAGKPAFQNGWSNYGNGFGRAGYWEDQTGYFHLQGIVTGGTPGSTIFTLPLGFRPQQDTAFSVAAGVGGPTAENVDVLTDGEVLIVGSVNSAVSLYGISFRL